MTYDIDYGPDLYDPCWVDEWRAEARANEAARAYDGKHAVKED